MRRTNVKNPRRIHTKDFLIKFLTREDIAEKSKEVWLVAAGIKRKKQKE